MTRLIVTYCSGGVDSCFTNGWPVSSSMNDTRLEALLDEDPDPCVWDSLKRKNQKFTVKKHLYCWLTGDKAKNKMVDQAQT